MEYFDEKFMLDESIAAYLLKTAGADESEFMDLGLSDLKDTPARDLLKLLADSLPGASR